MKAFAYERSVPWVYGGGARGLKRGLELLGKVKKLV